MKKGKIILIVIWILLLIGIFVYSKNKKEIIEPIEPEIAQKESLDKYEFIDYTGYYDENDLFIEKLYIDEEQYFSYIKISGLKDKSLEEKINKKLYDLVNEQMDKGYTRIHSFVPLNAFNVLSVYIDAYKDNNSDYKTINIDLTTGNEITLSDIVNTKNLIKPLSHAYYDSASFMINSEIKRKTMYLDEYNECIKSDYSCDGILGGLSVEETKELIKTYENYIPTIEDESLEYARNFDINTEFYMTSAGIIIPNVNMYDLTGNNEIMIYTKDNPRLFNYYYKYKTDESIYNGTYEGIKNIMLSEYIQYMQIEKPHTELIDDYALIHFEYYNEKNEENKQLLDEYIKRLDKNNFTFIYEASIYEDEYFSFSECTMTKDTYNNEVKKEFADGMLKSRHTQGHYGLKNQNISCENKMIYLNNMNVEVIYDYDNSNITTNQKVRIINNQEKTEEINNSIQNELNQLINKYKSIGVYVNNITETQVFIEIDYYDKDFNRYVKELTFDL